MTSSNLTNTSPSVSFLFFPPSILCMGSLFFPLFFILSCDIVSGFSLSEFVYPNFTASNFRFIDNSGTFLSSRNGSFKAAIFNPGAQQTNFYLCIVHVASNAIVWSANRDAPISSSGTMNLTSTGISIVDQDGSFKWSTPPLQSSVSAMMLTETGNLVLLNRTNGSVWQSFHYPTDTIVITQQLAVGTLLSSAVSDDDLSSGKYSLAITPSDAILQWQGLTYWKLSMDTKAYSDSNYAVEYMAINQTGLYLVGRGGLVVVIEVDLDPSDFRIAKLDYSGQFVVSSFSGSDWKKDFEGPANECHIGNICGKMGLCTYGTGLDDPACICPPEFHDNAQNTSGCSPNDASLPVACNSSTNSSDNSSSEVSYVRLDYGMDYFANDFTSPVKYGVNLSACQELCSEDCSCLGVFYGNSSGTCYVLENVLGSIQSSSATNSERLGFIKVIGGSSPTSSGGNSDFGTQSLEFPIVALILLPFTGLSLLLALGFFWWRKSRMAKVGEVKSGYENSPSSGDLDAFAILGLPKRFDYEELEAATDNFKIHIGSGGFGSVYKGVLGDKTLVAVKKITNLGVQGKKDFCTEIAVIGNIHHVNLVKLRGFCAQGRQRLLVYEYMNRGSLDRSLFGNGPVLEWQERIEIALGTARALAYLHCGCEHKIIHCDVKPENILLHDQFQAKISDFGLSKLLSPEQSSLFTTMRGTRGYLAPEWLTSSAISEKTDVYSFGMVLLEIVSGRKNCSLPTQSHSIGDNSSGAGHSSGSSGPGLIYFPLFALEMHEQGRYLELADPRLEGRVTGKEVEKLVRVALCCVHEEPAMRPNMVIVVGMLEGEVPLGQPRMDALNFLRFYGRRFTEASMIGENNGQDNVMLYPEANASLANRRTSWPTSYSYISSQEVSGPR